MFLVTAMATGCGDDKGESSDTPAAEEEPATASGLDPAAVEASVEEFLVEDEAAAALSATVDCGDQPGETLECTVTGDKGLQGVISAFPSPGFQYTGEIEGPDGPSSLGGSSSDGDVTDPASVEARLNEILADQEGEPSASCPDAAGGDSIECEVSGDEVTGTLTATPIGGFEWEGQIETPDGTRAIAGNALPD